MKKSCYGLLLVCAITFGLSLSGCSDTSALKYAYDAYPLYVDSQYLCGDSCNAYSHHSSTAFSIIFDYNPNDYDNIFSSNSLNPVLIDSNDSGYELCSSSNSLSSIFKLSFVDSRNQFQVNSGSSSNSFYKQKLSDYYPSSYPSCLGSRATRWSYDSIYSAQYNLVTGDPIKLVDLTNFYFSNSSNVPGRSTGSIKSINVPLTLFNMPHVSSGTVLEWDFGLVGDPSTISVNSGTRSDFTISYYTLNPDTNSYSDFYDSYTSTSSSSLCSVDTNYDFAISNGDLQILRFEGLNVHCTFTAPTDMYYIYPSIKIYGDVGLSYNSNSFLTWSDDGGVFFTGSYLITGGDDTWSGEIMNATPTGDNMNSNSSYVQLYGTIDDGSCLDGDFLCELSHLFDFSALNPFAPIFDLFTDNSSCSSIPIIAGMLNSSEITYCPWFSSTTRNILTPVLGLASSMLIFGFFVRWLGSSSGNMFEDQTSHKWGNTQIKSKGGKK